MRLIFLLATAQCQIYKGMRAADHAKITKGPSQFGKLRTRGPTLPPPVEESQIFGAWIEGKRDSTKWVSFRFFSFFNKIKLNVFASHNIKLWHHFEYKETGIWIYKN